MNYALASDCAWCGTGEGICEEHAEALFSQQASRHNAQTSADQNEQQLTKATNAEGEETLQTAGNGGRR